MASASPSIHGWSAVTESVLISGCVSRHQTPDRLGGLSRWSRAGFAPAPSSLTPDSSRARDSLPRHLRTSPGHPGPQYPRSAYLLFFVRSVIRIVDCGSDSFGWTITAQEATHRIAARNSDSCQRAGLVDMASANRECSPVCDVDSNAPASLMTRLGFFLGIGQSRCDQWGSLQNAPLLSGDRFSPSKVWTNTVAVALALAVRGSCQLRWVFNCGLSSNSQNVTAILRLYPRIYR